MTFAVSNDTLRALREARGWDEHRLAKELHAAARDAGEQTAVHHALVKMIKAWENGRNQPRARYLYLYRAVFPEFPWPGSNGAGPAGVSTTEVLERARHTPGHVDLAAMQLAALRSGQLDLVAFADKLLAMQEQVDKMAEDLERLLGEGGA